MKKSLLFLCAFLAVSMMANAQPASPVVNGRGTTDMWDFVKSFSCSTGRQHGVVYDGEYLYTSAWEKSSTVLSMFYKYDLVSDLSSGAYLLRLHCDEAVVMRRFVKE